MNSVALMGRLTKDVKLTYSRDNMAIANFTIAINRKNKREEETNADYFNCVAFGKIAEFVEKYFTKGKMIAVVGRLATGKYVDEYGTQHSFVKINCNDVSFCGDSSKTVEESSTEFKELEEEKTQNLQSVPFDRPKTEEENNEIIKRDIDNTTSIVASLRYDEDVESEEDYVSEEDADIKNTASFDLEYNGVDATEDVNYENFPF